MVRQSKFWVRRMFLLFFFTLSVAKNAWNSDSISISASLCMTIMKNIFVSLYSALNYLETMTTSGESTHPTVLILDGYSDIGAHLRSNLCYQKERSHKWDLLPDLFPFMHADYVQSNHLI